MCAVPLGSSRNRTQEPSLVQMFKDARPYCRVPLPPSTRGGGTGTRMTRRKGTSGRAYRTKVEVFRDVLVATRLSSKKTRIMGLANLNPATFRRHMAVARSQGLVTVIAGEYLLTEKANRALQALDDLVARSRELDDVVRFLEQNALPPSASQWPAGEVLRRISSTAWSDAQRGDGALSSAFSRSGASTSLAGIVPDPLRVPLDHSREPPEARGSRTAVRSNPDPTWTSAMPEQLTVLRDSKRTRS